MPWQFARDKRRPFQYLFFAMEYFHSEAKEFFDRIHAQDFTKPEKLDNRLWMQEKAVSRACVLNGVAGLEALANTLIKDFRVRDKDDIPRQMLTRTQKKNPFDRWPLADKVYFLPALCNKTMSPPACYFQRDSRAFSLFEEIVLIRNSIMHGRPTPALILIRFKKNRKHESIDDFDANYWPLTRIPRDLALFNYECADKSYQNVKWVRDSLIDFVDEVDRKYLVEEKIDLVSRVITDDEIGEEELLRSWGKFVVEAE